MLFQEFKASYWMIAVYVLNTRMILALISLLALVMGIAVGAFLVYHCYLLFIGQTTNETFKWGKS